MAVLVTDRRSVGQADYLCIAPLGRMSASAADRVEFHGHGARPWPCPRGQSAAANSARRGRRLALGSPSRRATRVLAGPRKEAFVRSRSSSRRRCDNGRAGRTIGAGAVGARRIRAGRGRVMVAGPGSVLAVSSRDAGPRYLGGCGRSGWDCVVGPASAEDAATSSEIRSRVEVPQQREAGHADRSSAFRHPQYESGRHGRLGRGGSREHAVDVGG